MGKSDYDKGMKTFAAIHGSDGLEVLERIKKICPEMARFIIEYPFGKIYSRKKLSRRMRQVATIASLTTLGHAPKQLKSHIKAALRAGLSREEIVEVILQMSVYAGFPAALNALYVLSELSGQNGKRRKKKVS